MVYKVPRVSSPVRYTTLRNLDETLSHSVCDLNQKSLVMMQSSQTRITDVLPAGN